MTEMPQDATGPEPAITGNGVTFHDERDLTDQTHALILYLLLNEVQRTDMTTEGMKAATRAVRKVERAAKAAGWTDRCAALLGIVAADIYGKILADVAKGARP